MYLSVEKANIVTGNQMNGYSPLFFALKQKDFISPWFRCCCTMSSYFTVGKSLRSCPSLGTETRDILHLLNFHLRGQPSTYKFHFVRNFSSLFSCSISQRHFEESRWRAWWKKPSMEPGDQEEVIGHVCIAKFQVNRLKD